MQGLGERSRVISRPLLDPLAWAFMFSLTSLSLQISTPNLGFLEAPSRLEIFQKVQQLTRQSWTIIISVVMTRLKLLPLSQIFQADSQLNTLAPRIRMPIATAGDIIRKGQ